MTQKALGIQERAALLVLMVENRELSNPELQALAGFSLTGARRKLLEDRKLVESRKGKRGAYLFTLTEKGWSWCSEELAQDPPARAGTAAGALYALLHGLRRYLERSNLTVADVFGGAATREEQTEDLDTQIRAAYKRHASQPRAWVSLADLRDELMGYSRADVDEALRRMSRAQELTLVPESNQKTLSERQRQASIRLGGEDVHLVMVQTS